MAKRLHRLFNHNPPPFGDPLAAELFVDRERELREGVELLGSGDDTSPLIYAIHGDSRTGKSHLARRVIDALDDRFTVVELNAAQMGTARMALEGIFARLFAELDALPESMEGPDGLQAEDVFRPWRAWFRRILPLIEGHQSRVEVEVARAVHDAVSARLGSRHIAHIEVKEQTVDKTARTVTIEKPDDWTLVRYVHQLTDVLWYAYGQRPVLVYVDDLDLLTRRHHRDDHPEAERLTDMLEPLAASPRVVVVASVRSLYLTTRDKAFHDYLRVKRFPHQRLREVYDRQVALLHDGEPIFAEAALERLLDTAAGRVGVFLRQCAQLFRHAERRAPIGEQVYWAWVEDEIRELMRNPETAEAMETVGRWLIAGETHGQLPGVDPEDGPLAFLVVRPASLGGAGRVAVVTELRDVIRRLVASAR